MVLWFLYVIDFYLFLFLEVIFGSCMDTQGGGWRVMKRDELVFKVVNTHMYVL